MITKYSPKYKKAVSELISYESKSCISYEMYIFNTFGEIFRDSSFIFVKGGAVVGFVGVITSIEQKTLHIYSLRVSKFYDENTISSMLTEKVVIYANKNGFKKISFPINTANFKNYRFFSGLAKRLNRQMTKRDGHKEDTFIEYIYTIHLDKPAGSLPNKHKKHL